MDKHLTLVPTNRNVGLEIYYQTGRTKSRDTFEKITVEGLKERSTHLEFFKNIEKYLKQIPEENLVNAHLTVANVYDGAFIPPWRKDGKPTCRNICFQQVIAFDIDYKKDNVKQSLDKGDWEKYRQIIGDALSIEPEKITAVWSGHGLHFYLHLMAPIPWSEFFEIQKDKKYAILCDVLNVILKEHELPGEFENIWQNSKTLRLPGTTNRKEGMPDTFCQILEIGDEVDFDFKRFNPSLQEIERERIIHGPAIDREAVLAGCDFLKWVKDKPNEVNRVQWVNALSILSLFENKLAHDYSEGYYINDSKKYSYEETEREIQRIKTTNRGPKWCSAINKTTDKCRTCPHNGEVVSPAYIKGEDFIATRKTGFRDRTWSANGSPSKNAPINREDLLKQFIIDFGLPQNIKGAGLHYYQDNIYHPVTREKIYSWAQSNVSNPLIKISEKNEIYALIENQAYLDLNEVSENQSGMIPFQNGIYDFKTDSLIPYSPDYFFTYKVSCDYDPNATSPLYDKFMSEILDDSDAATFLHEWVGNGLAGTTNQIYSQAVYLYGDGCNGKSTFVNLIIRLLSGKNYTAFSTVNYPNLARQSYALVGKPFNICEETIVKTQQFSEVMEVAKAIITGNNVNIERKYQDTVSVRLDTKLLFVGNEMLRQYQATRGWGRRWTVIHFKNEIEEEKIDPLLGNKLANELPGIVNHFIAGFKRLHENEKFTSGRFKQEGEELLKEGCPIYEMMRDDLDVTLDPNDVLSNNELYDYFVEHYDNRTRMNAVHFKRKLSNHLKLNHSKRFDFNYCVNSVRGCRGIKWKHPPVSEI